MNTIRVRIAVVVDVKAIWQASGSSLCGDETSEQVALDCHPGDPDDPTRTTYIEADVPLPIEQPVDTVEGEIK